MGFARTFSVLVATFLFCEISATLVLAQQGSRDGEWRHYAGDLGATKFAPLDQISRDNVDQLQVAWERAAVDQSILEIVPDLSYGNNFIAAPLMVDGILYSPNGVGLVEASHGLVDALDQRWLYGPGGVRRDTLTEFGAILDPEHDGGGAVHGQRVLVCQGGRRLADFTRDGPEGRGALEIERFRIICRLEAVKFTGECPRLYGANSHDGSTGSAGGSNDVSGLRWPIWVLKTTGGV